MCEEVLSQTIHMRYAWAAFGLAFAGFGMIALAAAAIVIVGRGDLTGLLVALPAVLALMIGLAITLRTPWNVTFDDIGLTLSFALRTVRVPWDKLLSFRKVALRMSLRGGEARVYTLITYERANGSTRRALLLLPGTGLAFASSPNDYETELDRRVPLKNAKVRTTH